MTAFLIADIKVTDDKWVPDYAASVHELVHKHGGKYLSRSGNVKTLEGAPLDTSLIAIMSFPSAKARQGLRQPIPPTPVLPRRAGAAAKAAFNSSTIRSGRNDFVSRRKFVTLKAGEVPEIAGSLPTVATIHGPHGRRSFIGLGCA